MLAFEAALAPAVGAGVGFWISQHYGVGPAVIIGGLMLGGLISGSLILAIVRTLNRDDGKDS
jgi:hypothetical protein